jgi:hypothetical protein
MTATSKRVLGAFGESDASTHIKQAVPLRRRKKAGARMKYEKPEVLVIPSALNAISSTNTKLGPHVDINAY